MRVAVLSYPMLFQGRRGMGMGLQNVIVDTVNALNEAGCEARLIDIIRERMTDYDLVQLYCVTHGNHRIVESAKALGIPIVVAPRRPTTLGKRDRLVGGVLNRVVARISGYQDRTSYGYIKSALHAADLLCARGNPEKRALVDAYDVDPAGIEIVPNGVATRFFEATPDLFLERFPMRRPIVLCASGISPYKNQLGVIEALRNENVDFALAGAVDRDEKDYLQSCLEAAPGRVHYLGEFDPADPVLISGFAAAAVHVLVSRGETGPNVALESLAAGTPVVVPRQNGLELERDRTLWREARYGDPADIRSAVCALLETPKRPDRCRALVANLSWTRTAEQLVSIYSRVLQKSAAR